MNKLKLSECEICHKMVYTCHLKRHKKQHKYRTNYICSVCDSAFRTKITLQCHIEKGICVSNKTENNQKTSEIAENVNVSASCNISKQPSCSVLQKTNDVECAVCLEKVKSAVLNEHMQQHTIQENKWNCGLCRAEFVSISDYRMHVEIGTCKGVLKRKKKNNLLKCNRCHRFIFDINFRHHMKQHIENRPYKCSSCGVGFHKKDSLLKHEKKICNISRKLKSKIKILEDNASMQLKVNDNILPRKKVKKASHRKGRVLSSKVIKVDVFSSKIHSMKKKGKICHICHRPIRDSDYRRHISMHAKCRPYRCPSCDLGFDYKIWCDKHIASKTCDLSLPVKQKHQLKPPSINKDKKIIQASKMNVDSGEIVEASRVVKCHMCHRFIRNNSVRLHLKLHEKDGPYKCPFCGLGFSYMNSRYRHMKRKICLISVLEDHLVEPILGSKSQKMKKSEDSVDSGRKHSILKCHICHEFVQKRYFKRHLFLHTDNRPYKCPYCHLGFNYQTNWKKHVSKKTCGIFSITRDSLIPNYASVNTSQESYPSKTLAETPNSTSKGKFVECNICNRNVRNCMIKRHMKQHSPDNPHICPKCHLGFCSKSSLTNHLFRNTCSPSFPKKDHNLGLFTEKDDQDVDLTKSVAEPSLVGCKWKVVECPHCLRKISNHKLKVHIRQHTEYRPFRCPTCKLGFQDKGNCKKHVLSNVCKVQQAQVSSGNAIGNGGNPKILSAKPTLKVQGSKWKQNDVCPICNKKVSAGYLNHHMKKHRSKETNVQERDRDVPEISSQGKAENKTAFFSLKELVIPLVRLEDEALHAESRKVKMATRLLDQRTCFVCRKKYPSFGFDVHMEEHMFQRTFACLVCKTSFTNSMNCKRHMYSAHSSLQKTPCRFCSGDIRTSKQLLAHFSVHRNVRLYRCLTCNKFLRDHYYLKNHFEKHQVNSNSSKAGKKISKSILSDAVLDTKETSCFVCQEKFSHSKQLVHHMKIHVAEELSFTSNDSRPDSTECEEETAVYVSDIDDDEEEQGDIDNCLEPDMENFLHKSYQNIDPLDDSDSLFDGNSLTGDDFSYVDNVNEHLELQTADDPSLQNLDSIQGGSPNCDSERQTLLPNSAETESNDADFSDPTTEQCAPIVNDKTSSRETITDATVENENIGVKKRQGLSSNKCEVTVFITENSFQENELFGNSFPMSKLSSQEISDPLMKNDNFGEAQNPDDYNPLSSGSASNENSNLCFKCAFCSERFSCSDSFQAHLIKHSQDNVQVCNSVFRQKSVSQKHSGHGNEKKYKCSVCLVDFLLDSDLKAHMNTHVMETNFKCKVCPVMFSLEGELVQHMLTHSQDEPFSCDMCDLTFMSFSSLQLHMKGHLQEDGQEAGGANNLSENCVDSINNVTNSLVLDNNGEIEKTVKDRAVYRCVICDKSFSTWVRYLKHRKLHGKLNRNAIFECKDCGKVLKNLFTYRTHIRSHNKRKCKICGKVTKNPWVYRKHVKSHIGIVLKDQESTKVTGISELEELNFKPEQLITDESQPGNKLEPQEKHFACRYCDKTVSNVGGLARHLRTHRNIIKRSKALNLKNPWWYREHMKSSVSGIGAGGENTESSVGVQEFGKENLESQLRSDKSQPGNNSVRSQWIEEKHLVCRYCDKVVANKGCLARHMKIHEKHYMCRYCDKFVGNKGNLVRHMKIHENMVNIDKVPPNIQGAESLHPCGIVGGRENTESSLVVQEYGKEHFESQQQRTGKSQPGNISVRSQWIEEKHLVCRYCDEVVGNKGNLAMHMKTHEDMVKMDKAPPDTQGAESLHPCGECLEVFTCKKELIRHSSCHKGIERRSFWDGKQSMCLKKTHTNAHILECMQKTYNYDHVTSLKRQHSTVTVTENDNEVNSETFFVQLPSSNGNTEYVNNTLSNMKLANTRNKLNKLHKTKRKVDVDKDKKTRSVSKKNEDMKLASRTCGHCGKVFPFQSMCVIHVAKHSQKDRKCSLCTKTFYTNKAFIKHTQNHTKEIISDRTEATSSEAQHSGSCNNERKVSLEVTNSSKPESMRSIANGGGEARTEQKKKKTLASRTCHHCGKVFPFKSVCILHVARHSKKDHRCTVCNRTFYNHKEFIRHTQTHERKVIAHNLCQSNKADAQNNTNGSEEPGILKGKLAQDKICLSELQHQSNLKVVRCKVCHQRLPTYKSYYRHQRLHFKRSRNRCNLCSTKFRKRSQFLMHMRTYHPKSENCCTYCDDRCNGLCEFNKFKKPSDFNLLDDGSIKGGKVDFKSCQLDGSDSENISHDVKLNKLCRVVLEKLSVSKMQDMITPCNSLASEQLKCTQEFDSVVKREIDRLNATFVLDKTKKKPYICRICDKDFISVLLIKRHLKRHRQEKHCKCRICGKTSSTFWNLKKHMQIHISHRNKQYDCNVCGHTFHQKPSLVQHVKKLHSEMNETKKIVDKKSSCSEMVEHDGDKNAQKEEEVTPQTSRQPQKSYIRSAEKIANSALQCNTSDLDRGLESDSNKFKSIFGTNFVCPICGKATESLHRFDQHMITHSEDRPFRCPLCKKIYKRLISMRRHIQDMHSVDPSQFHPGSMSSTGKDITVDLPYKCSVCDKGFIYDTGLKIHMMLHYGESSVDTNHCNELVYECAIETNEEGTTTHNPFSLDIAADNIKEEVSEDVTIDIKEENVEDLDLIDDAFCSEHPMNDLVSKNKDMEVIDDAFYNEHPMNNFVLNQTLTTTSQVTTPTSQVSLVGDYSAFSGYEDRIILNQNIFYGVYLEDFGNIPVQSFSN